jgi:hypothetical protein
MHKRRCVREARAGRDGFAGRATRLGAEGADWTGEMEGGDNARMKQVEYGGGRGVRAGEQRMEDGVDDI